MHHSLITVKFSDHHHKRLPKPNQTKRRNICSNKIRKAKANYQRELIDQNLSNPRKFWNAIKIIFPIKTKKVCRSSCNKKDSAKKFSVFFSTIVQNLRAKSFPLMICTWRYPDSALSHRTDLLISPYESITYTRFLQKMSFVN